MLGRRLSSIQWASLVTLGLGVATMQLGAISARENDSHGHGKHPATEAESMNYLAGVSAVLVSCFSSAIAATYFELVIKRQPVVPPVEEIMLVAPPKIKPASLWVRNIQLSLFSSVIGVAVVMLQANHFHLDAISGLSLDFKGLFDPLEHWYDPVVRAGEGFFEGLTDNPMAWAVIFLQTVGGLLIAVAIKHADNIAKGFALAVSIVFTFLLSVVLFDFQPTLASVLGGAAVVASTIMFEMAPKEIRGLFAAEPHGHKKAVMRRWHYMLVVIMGTTLWAGIFPSIRSLSSGTSKWDLLHHEHDNQLSLRQPTIAIADMTPITEKLTKAAHICGWGVRPFRETTTSAYGGSHPMPSSYPYWVTNANQYALDDILTTRFATYPKAVPLLASPSPDFIFLPILSQLWSNPWRCEATELRDAIERTTQFLRDLVASVGETPYPRIVVPIATLRSNLEEILAPELMAELKDSVVFVSIENAPKTHAEGLKYLIDVPCAFLTSQVSIESRLTIITAQTRLHSTFRARTRGARPASATTSSRLSGLTCSLRASYFSSDRWTHSIVRTAFTTPPARVTRGVCPPATPSTASLFGVRSSRSSLTTLRRQRRTRSRQSCSTTSRTRSTARRTLRFSTSTCRRPSFARCRQATRPRAAPSTRRYSSVASPSSSASGRTGDSSRRRPRSTT